MSRLLVPLPAPPTDPPGVVRAATPNSIRYLVGRGLLRVRLAVSDESPIRVRPWFYADGRWWPLRAASDPGVGTEPVSADSDLYQGKADQFYVIGQIANYVVVVFEDGAVEQVEAMYLDLVDAPGA
jgi:hypothetical protein